MSLRDWIKRRREERAALDARNRAPKIDPETGEILPDEPASAEAAQAAEAAPAAIAGERNITPVNRERSIRARVGNALALGTVGLIAAAFLVWYYAAQFTKAGEARKAAQRQTETRAAGESTVPPLGRVDPPAAPPPRQTVVASTSVQVDEFLGPAPPVPPEPTAAGPQAPVPVHQAPPAKTPAQLELERKLAGPVMLYQTQARAAPAATAQAIHQAAQRPPMLGSLSGPGGDDNDAAPPRSFATQLTATATPAVTAQVLPTRRMLLPKGAFIDCTLETAIDSTHDGMVTCIGASDVYSADGKVVLLERGTKYVGERRGDVRRGQSRVFVLWAQARTPTGVVVDLASPGTDELGRAGLPGHVDNHFWDRFGAAILISVIDGSLQAVASSQQRQGSDSNNVVLNPTTGGDVLTEVLKSTISIPPTVIKNQGDRVQVLVARDIDFRSVYALRSEPDQR
jgi:type IV secretion system protein VirB10